MQQFTFNDVVIATRIHQGDIYFRCNDIVLALGYKSSKREPIIKFVSEDYITTFGKIEPGSSYDKSHTKYMKKNGVMELAFKCKLDTAKPFQRLLMNYVDSVTNARLEETALSYKSQLALTEQSHEEIVTKYKQRVADLTEEIDEKDEELERKDELLEEKDVEIDEMDQALEAKKIDACDERDRTIRELTHKVDELTDENYRLKEILEAVPEKYRGEYEVDDYEFIPSKRAREEKRERDSRIDDRREIDSYFKSKIVELKTLYDAVDRWKVRYAGTTLRKNKSAYKANYEAAHRELVEYLEKLKREEFFTKCKRNLDAYPIKFWQAYNGKLTG